MVVGLFLISVFLVFISFYTDSIQPKLYDYKFKHFIDVASYVLGPLILYSTMMRIFF